MRKLVTLRNGLILALLLAVPVTNSGCADLLGILETPPGGGGGDDDGGGDDGGGDDGGGDDGGNDDNDDDGTSGLSIVRTNQPVHTESAMHANADGTIIAFDFRNASGDLTVGYWNTQTESAFTDVRVTGFDNTAGVSDPATPLFGDFRCLQDAILLTDGRTIGLFDTASSTGAALTLPGEPGQYRYLNGSGVAGDGGRYGAAILEDTGEVDVDTVGAHKVVAVDGQSGAVVEFASDLAHSQSSSYDFYRVAVAGSRVALLRDDPADSSAFASTILVFDAAAPEAEPASFVADISFSSAVLEFDGRFALVYNLDEDMIVVFDTEARSFMSLSPQAGGTFGQIGHEQFAESITNGVVGYVASGGDSFGSTLPAATGAATADALATVIASDTTSISPPGFGNTVAVTVGGRVFSAGERDISFQGGNLSEVTGGSATFISDAVGDAGEDGFVAASDIGAVGNLVYFKTGADGSNNAGNDTVLSYFRVE